MMRCVNRYAGGVLLAVLLVAAPFAVDGDASHQKKRKKKVKPSVTVRRIGPGAYYKRIVKPGRHLKIHMVTVRLAARSSVDVALAGNELGHTDTVSSMARRSGAIAAINGDFGSRLMRPWNAYVQDGHLIQTETTWGRGLSLNAPGTSAFIDHPRFRIKVKPVGSPSIKIDRVNTGRPDPDEIALFSKVGRRVARPSLGACSSRLVERGPPTLDRDGSIIQLFAVHMTRCDYERMNLQGGVVVSARRNGSRKTELKTLAPGQDVKLKWSLPIDEVVDILGGNPMIVNDGRLVGNSVYNCGFLCRSHPRTGVGFTRDGKLLMVVVDGRSKSARGLRLYELARFFIRQGAERAMNLDGGGASEMWIRGKVVNRPSDGRERPAVNALVLLPGEDLEQPASASTTAAYGASPLDRYATRAGLPRGERALEAAVRDPGSLGGLADYLERRGKPISSWMHEVARSIRAREGG